MTREMVLEEIPQRDQSEFEINIVNSPMSLETQVVGFLGSECSRPLRQHGKNSSLERRDQKPPQGTN